MAQYPGCGCKSRRTGSFLLFPRPRRIRRQQEILDEDEFTAKMEAIIERDFFPDIPKLQNKLEWLQAVRSGDPERIRQAQISIAARRARMQQTPGSGASGLRAGIVGTPLGAGGHTPGGGATPMVFPRQPRSSATPGALSAGEEVEGLLPEPAVPAMSLDEFCAAHTGEDNAAFGEIVDK